MPDDPDTPQYDSQGFLPAEVPPAWGTETRTQRLSRLSRTARDLPASPGVYLMKDGRDVVIYVGKAANLPDRVGSYFTSAADLGIKKQPLLDEVHWFEIIECASEWEALLTENRLIKDIKPKYNARLIDDKTFPYLVVTKNEDYPRVFVTRNPSGQDQTGNVPAYLRKARIFGPFTNAGALREAVQVLQRVFKYRTCKLDILESDPKNAFFRPCLLHAIGQCTAPCANKISAKAYEKDADRFVKFLGSKRTTVLKEMRDEMEQLSRALKFEEAAAVRDQLRAIERLSERGTIKDGWQPETEIGYVDPERGVRSLQRALELDVAPRCIEGFDIAHLQGTETVASKVCFVDGKPFKDEYRRFRIQTAGNDDYASIREVISRRYREAGDGNELYPEVILIDGGLGQLHAALEVFSDLEVRPPMVISLAKKQELIYKQERADPIRLGRENPGLKLVQYIRDEAHRFAQHYHHVLRRKRTLNDS